MSHGPRGHRPAGAEGPPWRPSVAKSSVISVARSSLPTAVHADRATYVTIGKPIIDRVVAATFILLLLPIMALIALAIIVTLGRPVIYRQWRVGKDGKPFVLWKFRTMLPDRRSERLAVPADKRVCHKRDDDPRHVPFGSFLRRTSLDELPQFFNVLLGHMSVVGPRPELVEIVERYEPWQHVRHAVKPGITGLWQVSGRGSGLMHENVELDLEYLNQLSLRSDLGIILRTPRVFLTRSGS